MRWIATPIFIMLTVRWALAEVPERVCGVYTSIPSFAGKEVMQAAVNSNPSFLLDKHKKWMATADNTGRADRVRDAGFNAVFMTIYPLWGKQWWTIPTARNMVKDAVVQANKRVRVHLGLSLFNGGFCDDPSRYPGASRTIQCDGTRPSWVCFFDDELWKTYARNVTEMLKVGREAEGGLAGIFVDPEAYGPECYLCFCDNCVRKFDTWSGRKMPTGLVKPDGWLHEHGMWKTYTVDWHDQEVRRHALELRMAIRQVDADVQISSLLWDYPVAVGIGDPRQAYFRQLAIGLGTKEKPAWVLPEHTYYSDAPDLERIIKQVRADIREMGAQGVVDVLPGIRILRRDAASLIPRAHVIRDSNVPGYWMYEWADLEGKAPIDFEGDLVDPAEKYLSAFKEANAIVRTATPQAH